MAYTQITLLVEPNQEIDADFLVKVLLEYLVEKGIKGAVEVTHPTEQEFLEEIEEEFDEDDLRV